MKAIIKTPDELIRLRKAGARLAKIVSAVAEKVRPGISTAELDEYAYQLCSVGTDRPAFLNYTPEGADIPFPASACISVNEEVVHGIPKKETILSEGDIVSIDIGLCHEGVFVDHAVTVPVGEISIEKKELLKITKQALDRAIAILRPGIRIGDIGNTIEKFVAGRYGIVRELAGHGVGRGIHEDPVIPNYGKTGTGSQLQAGMVIALEPMLNLGSASVLLLDDGYTFITADKKASAHFEHTIEITQDGARILTEI